MLSKSNCKFDELIPARAADATFVPLISALHSAWKNAHFAGQQFQALDGKFAREIVAEVPEELKKAQLLAIKRIREYYRLGGVLEFLY